MDSSLLRLGTAMLNYESKISVVANNISNANTPGYKADTAVSLSFDESFSEAIENSINSENEYTKYTQLETYTSYRQGNLMQTDDQRDLAINGKGFFVVKNGTQELYIRTIKTTIDKEGYLIDQHGNRIQGQTGDILIGDRPIAVMPDGAIIATETNTLIDRLQTTDFDNYNGIGKLYGGYFGNVTANKVATQNIEIKQGYQEQSNLDVTEEYMQMMSVSNIYKTTQKVIQMVDTVNGQTVTEIGQV